MGFILYRSNVEQEEFNAIVEGKSSKPSLEKIQVTTEFDELPGEEIEQVYGCWSGRASEILNVLNDITEQTNKDVEEGGTKSFFNQNVMDFIEQMGNQKAFVFAYRNPNGLNANLYTSQVEFNNAVRAKKKSTKAIKAFTDGITKHIGAWNDLVTSFGELDDRKLNNLSNVLDKAFENDSININKGELGKFFGMLSNKFLGITPAEPTVEQTESPEVDMPNEEEPVLVNGEPIETPSEIEQVESTEGNGETLAGENETLEEEPKNEVDTENETVVAESYYSRFRNNKKRLGSHIFFN